MVERGIKVGGREVVGVKFLVILVSRSKLIVCSKPGSV